MRIQVTMTVAEGKRLIAKAVASLPEVQQAKVCGKILLKGGTTVSAIAEELFGLPMRICGRITRNGTKTARYQTSAPHILLFDNGSTKSIDNTEAAEQAILSLGPDDVLITGANLIDSTGQAAIMIGGALRSFGGGYLH